MNELKTRWFHALVEDTLSGEFCLLGVRALDQKHAENLLPWEKSRAFGDAGMFYMFHEWYSDAEAEASGLDEF